MTVREIALWPFRQMWGFLANIGALITGTGLRDVLPPWVADWILGTITFLVDSVPKAFGFTDTPQEHLLGIVVVSVALVLFSFTTLTIVAVVFAVIATPIALLRFFPAVEQRWPLSSTSWSPWSGRS
jgi:hypothetical protein